MAEFVYTNAFLSIGGTDLSDHVRQATLEYNAEMQDKTAMGDLTRTRLGGLKDWTLTLNFNQDFAASNVDATLFPLVGTSVAIILRPDAGVVSATNPNFTGNAILESYAPLGGNVGDMAETPVSFQADGTLTRAVA